MKQATDFLSFFTYAQLNYFLSMKSSNEEILWYVMIFLSDI